jgi:hypothetical protein
LQYLSGLIWINPKPKQKDAKTKHLQTTPDTTVFFFFWGGCATIEADKRQTNANSVGNS